MNTVFITSISTEYQKNCENVISISSVLFWIYSHHASYKNKRWVVLIPYNTPIVYIWRGVVLYKMCVMWIVYPFGVSFFFTITTMIRAMLSKTMPQFPHFPTILYKVGIIYGCHDRELFFFRIHFHSINYFRIISINCIRMKWPLTIDQ